MCKVKVSVISGFYNREKFVLDSVNSILNQSHTDFEYIIFDDSSSDNTKELISELRDERIVKMMFNENKGFVNGLIDAVERSQGEYIFIHGAGDISHPDRIKKQLEVLEAGRYGVVGCYYENLSEDNKRLNVVMTKQEELSLENMFIYNRISHGEVAFKKSIYEKAGKYERGFRFSQDYDLWLRMLRHTEFFIVPEILYSRRIIKNSVSINPEKILEQAKFSVLARIINKYPGKRQLYLKKLNENGINDLIPQNNYAIQRICKKKSLLLINYAYWDDAEYLINKISSFPVRYLIKAIHFVLKLKVMPGWVLDYSIKISRYLKIVNLYKRVNPERI